MKTSYKSFLIEFLLNGIIFTSLTTGLDYIYNHEFSETKFLLDFTVFGLGMTLLNRYFRKKKLSQKSS